VARTRRLGPLGASLVLLAALGWFGLSLGGSSRDTAEASLAEAALADGDRDPDSRLREADAAMYLAKERGRFRYEFSDA
jgi:GGDEF domain-containing protein